MSPVAETAELLVSGRLCLFGEHSDWAGEHKGRADGVVEGRTIVVGTQEGIFATAKALSEKARPGLAQSSRTACKRTIWGDMQVLRIATTDYKGKKYGPEELPLEPAALLAAARKGGFFSYVAGTAYRILVAHQIDGGLQLDNHTTSLPMSAGLSSSAAICVMVARAFNTLYGLRLTTRGEMEFAYQGEIATPSKCGRMDQACAYGSVPVCMTFDGDILTVERARLAAPLYLVLVDLRASKDTTSILRALQQAYPAPASDAHRGLHSLLGQHNLAITGRALEAMAAGDVEGLGRLMVEAQALFDSLAGPLCPEQLTAPVLHKVLSHPPIQPLLWGGKGVGSQGDGTAQLLCRGPEAQAQVCAILSSELGVGCMPLTVQPTERGAEGESASG